MSHLFRRRNGDVDDLVGTSDMTPVDLAAVQADDALLNTLGRTDVVRDDTDAELDRVLVAWRREVDTESIGPLVDLDTAVAMISAARKPSARPHSVLGAVAAAAAVLVVAFAGVGLGAKSAQPGDRLFPLAKVLYSEYARSVEAAEAVKTELGQAKAALKEGDTSEARESLERVQEHLAVIAVEQGHDGFETEARKLNEMLQGTTSPPEPVPTPSPTLLPTSEVPEEPVSSSAPTTVTTPSPAPSSESEPRTTDPTTLSSPTVSAEPESPTAETRSGGTPSVDGEESPPPSVTVPSG